LNSVGTAKFYVSMHFAIQFGYLTGIFDDSEIYLAVYKTITYRFLVPN